MNRAETEDGSYASARNRKLLTKWAAKAGESEYAEPALNPCQTTAFEFFTDDYREAKPPHRKVGRLSRVSSQKRTRLLGKTGCCRSAAPHDLGHTGLV